MIIESKYKFFDVIQAAEFLNLDENEILRMVDNNNIPHCKFPSGELRFWPEHLKNWGLSFERSSKYRGQLGSAGQTDFIPLIEQISRRFHYKTQSKSRYINLYSGQKVFAQLHPSRTGDGVDLALRECGEDDKLPKCEVLQEIEQKDLVHLKGCWRGNKNWLLGDGRFTKKTAAALHIPNSLQDDLGNPGWKEVEALLEYASKKV